MANISAGTVNLGAGTYEVILRPVGGNNGRNNSGDESENDLIKPNITSGGKRAKKQKGGKTRKLSPYMKFAQEARPKLLKENPELKSDIPGMGRKIGEMWRALSDAEKARY